MTRRRLLLIAFALLLPAFARAQEKLPVVATFSVLGDMTREVGGDAVSVTVLVPPDGDAHEYQPRPSDLTAVRDAKVVVVNGLGMEGWMARLVRSSGTHAKVVTATAGITPRRLDNAPDPHGWQDPRNGVIYVRNIAAGLQAADPAHAPVYQANAARYVAQIQETDAWIEKTLSSVPPGKRKIITSHDAFGYFGARYGIQFRAAQGISTEDEPSARQIAALVGQIRREHIKAVFVENMSDPRIVDTLAKEAGAAVGGTVYSDALSPPGGPADTYLGMFHHNVPLFAAAMAAN